jgi:hypothetical protein
VFLFAIVLGMSLVVTSVFAQEDTSAPDDQSAPPPPSGPVLQPSDYTPTLCDPSAAGFRFDEIRGSGFDAWAGRHLVGSVLDGAGTPQVFWSNVWVSARGTLTLEVNLCSDPFINRPALPMGDYTVSVGPSAGSAIAATGFTVSAAPDASASDEAAAPTPTAAPRTGPGALDQPFPPGAPGNLVDGWQLVISGVSPDAYAGIKASIPSAIAPPADKRDYEVRIQATYLGPGTGVFSAVRIALFSTLTHHTYDQVVNSCGIVPESVPPKVVTQGTTLGGNVCFVVPASEIGSLVAFDNQQSEADRVYFGLQ